MDSTKVNFFLTYFHYNGNSELQSFFFFKYLSKMFQGSFQKYHLSIFFLNKLNQEWTILTYFHYNKKSDLQNSF